jgi:hypothetical protein
LYAEQVTDTGAEVRLAELVAALSLATDLGLGQPQQHIIRQTSGFSRCAGAGPLEAGTMFTSVGSVPMSLSRSENENEVLEARHPEILEFHTDALIVWRSGKRTEARYEHRFEIGADGTGSRVIYRLRQTAIANPPLRMRLPVIRTVTHRVMMPLFCRRGFRNMLRTAGRRGSTNEPAQTASGS